MSPEPKKLKVKAIIFDLDGTLIDSINIYFMIVENVLQRLNLPPVSRAAILAAAESENFNWDLVLPKELTDHKAKIIDQAWEVIDEIAPPLFEKNVKLMPGADGILRRVSAKGLKLGLVTSTRRSYLGIKMQPLRSAGVAEVFAAIITSDDTQKRKPAAEPLTTCAQKLRMNPAGMKTIGVLSGFDDLKSLQKEKPDAIIDSIGHLMDVIAF